MTGPGVAHVYKILPRAEWIAAQDADRFDGSEIDRRDGYIHLSTSAQAAETARLHFAGREELVLLKLRAFDLGEALRWEPSRDGELFPHLYGPLTPAQVRAANPLASNADGWPDPGPLEP